MFVRIAVLVGIAVLVWSVTARSSSAHGARQVVTVNRYDTRKNLEENEANAIGTEYARADLAGTPVSAQMKDALLRYTQLRRNHYLTRDPQEIASNERKTADLQTELWHLATQVANEKPTPIEMTAVN